MTLFQVLPVRCAASKVFLGDYVWSPVLWSYDSDGDGLSLGKWSPIWSRSKAESSEEVFIKGKSLGPQSRAHVSGQR